MPTEAVIATGQRVLVMLANEDKVTAQRVCQLIGMDKGSVSRTFKSMHAKGLISFSADAQDGRLRFASFTPAGRAMHDDILRYALQREQAFLAVLKPAEIDTLVGLLRRLHENLPQVEAASVQFVAADQLAKASARPKTPRKPSKKVTQ